MIIAIEALDTVFFKDGRPFTMGEDDWASSIFPPPPGVIYGALRSAYLARNLSSLNLAGTDNDPTRHLQLRAMALRMGAAARRQVFFPAPLDCARRKNASGKEKNRLYPLRIVRLAAVSSCPLDYILAASFPVESAEGYYCSVDTLADYLGERLDFYWGRNLDRHVYQESKTGIGRNPLTRTARDAQLYRAGTLRLCDLDIVVNLGGLELPEQGLLRLGGEGRAAAYYPATWPELPAVQFAPGEKLFKLYLATPALFEGGWLPRWLDRCDFTGTYAGLRLKLVTAAIGRPLSLGGFDMKQRKPKPMGRAVPAGSVYYFALLEGDIGQVSTKLHNQCISDYYPEQGYGWCLVGRVGDTGDYQVN
ncbi:type III-B CRISPR module-associated Cmr3 family protein [Desulfurispora thermophila]|uniref:type III-B CRISPR module-associated Cmr3 family protein n=1 Tax=Desulfurispora thermophila TaxID=265470 RepID=UPI000363B664|nr:type III-B CRISPR module-associated Cmr3 family protein [Desulfurispora thermophila]